MNESHSGKEYVDAITERQSDRRARAAFQDLVLKIAAPGAVLFDFGAGPGIDARFYAERGFTIGAYDVDPAMCEYFSAHCREFIRAGKISLDRGSYQGFLERRTMSIDRRIDLVTANFAPLNLIDDLRELFAKFDAITGPRGLVLASVLSPYFLGDLKYVWWWRNAGRLWREGRYSVPIARGCVVRRRLADFAAQSSPYFTLERVYRGAPSGRRGAEGVDMTRGGRNAWLNVCVCRYMFLLFRKRPKAHSQ